MKYRLLNWLACPGCRSADLRLETRKTRTMSVCMGHFEAGEVLPGVDLDRGEEQEVMEVAARYSLYEAVCRG